MKKILFKAIPLVAILATSYSASAAATQTVTFEGEVSSITCKVSINGDTDAVVLLPTVPASNLAKEGSTDGATPFTISITDCGNTAAATVGVVFLGYDVATATDVGVLGNTLEAGSGVATNVGIQILDDTGVAINIQPGVLSSSSNTVSVPAATQSAEVQYNAQYYALGAATAGKIKALADYSLTYF